MSQTTKRALEASLKSLLLKKPLDKITISDIAEDCGISRMTFYYHFKYIYDLVEWVCAEDAARALDGKKTCDTWEEGLLNIFDAVLENKPFILNVYRSANREQVETYLYKVIHPLIIGVIEEKAQGIPLRDADKDFIANFYKYAFVGFLLAWINNGLKEDPKQLVDRLSLLIHGSISTAVERFRTDKP